MLPEIGTQVEVAATLIVVGVLGVVITLAVGFELLERSSNSKKNRFHAKRWALHSSITDKLSKLHEFRALAKLHVPIRELGEAYGINKEVREAMEEHGITHMAQLVALWLEIHKRTEGGYEATHSKMQDYLLVDCGLQRLGLVCWAPTIATYTALCADTLRNSSATDGFFTNERVEMMAAAVHAKPHHTPRSPRKGDAQVEAEPKKEGGVVMHNRKGKKGDHVQIGSSAKKAEKRNAGLDMNAEQVKPAMAVEAAS